MQEINNKLLIIVGSAHCVADDIAACLSTIHHPPSTVSFMLIGLDAVDKYIGYADYFATYHPVDIEPAYERRDACGGNTDYVVIANTQYADQEKGHHLVDMIVPFKPPSGSSALLGTLAAIKLRYKKIILCGCPLTGKNDKGEDYAHYQKGWIAVGQQVKDYVRSMSGWTREYLGAPTEEWITEGGNE